MNRVDGRVATAGIAEQESRGQVSAEPRVVGGWRDPRSTRERGEVLVSVESSESALVEQDSAVQVRRRIDAGVIIGGGICGLAIGWHLARAGRPVTIFERGEAGHGATERIVLPVLAENLQRKLPDLKILFSRIKTDRSDWV